ncbi:hypothetical protein [Micromonospora sp. RTGN7]|uniref:hypothetical protein n=1 Tax=Micromonospora sp. RTGN7 TaxID=3016526 RepID=UPI0029FED27F|nr:hypothetical protein [Micromonospora sp. RTGN7]
MSGTTHHRSSHDAVAPSDVTDPLLWRLAYDVANAHQPDDNGHCHNLLCDGQEAPCQTMLNAERAMQLARGAAPAESRRPGAQDRSAAPGLSPRDTRTHRNAA